jgi:hypothetical protein
VALVGQDGLEGLDPPWGRFQALFLGGSTAWKPSESAAGLAREARSRGAWVHMGRCNTLRRFRHAYAIGCHSIDGTAFSRWPEHHIPRALGWLAALHGTGLRGRGAERQDLPLARRAASQILHLRRSEPVRRRRAGPRAGRQATIGPLMIPLLASVLSPVGKPLTL